jgi:hypothetical protein
MPSCSIVNSSGFTTISPVLTRETLALEVPGLNRRYRTRSPAMALGLTTCRAQFANGESIADSAHEQRLADQRVF